VLLIAYASSIWNGTANGWFMGPMIYEGKGCTPPRMRPKLHLLALGHAFRITGFMA
jgi:hypothetical protein